MEVKFWYKQHKEGRSKIPLYTNGVYRNLKEAQLFPWQWPTTIYPLWEKKNEIYKKFIKMIILSWNSDRRKNMKRNTNYTRNKILLFIFLIV